MEDNLLNRYLVTNILERNVGTGRDSVKSMIVERGRRDVDLKKKQSISVSEVLPGLTCERGKDCILCDTSI